MSSVDAKQGSAQETMGSSRPAEPPCMSSDRGSTYSPDSVFASMSILRTEDEVNAVKGTPDRNIAELEAEMVKYQNTACSVNPSADFAGTGTSNGGG